MLLDENVSYPETMDMMDVIRRNRSLLISSPKFANIMDNNNLMLENYIHRCCFHFGIHPYWIFVSFSREQSLLAKDRILASEWAWKAACGVVGQDGPGTSKPQFLGLLNQIFMCAKNSAWSAGIGPKDNFGYKRGLWPSWARWGENKTVRLLDNPNSDYECKSMVEYVQLVHCPHIETLETDRKIFERDVEPYWR